MEINELPIAELQREMAAGDLTARALVERYLDRIASLDKDGPRLNAVIELNPDALAIADALDAARRAKGSRGPLHGIPVLIKDNIDTHDRMQTTAGSLALAGHIAARDSVVARRLRRAGAVILGKTNLSEWANFRGQRSTSGWSSRGGQTRNPYALDRNPSGSSSGSAVAVAAGLCAVAVGTETDGSIMSPSSACGIVGIKPTVGLIGQAGIVPIAHSQDTAGPMARTVADAAILLGILAGGASRVPISRRDRNSGYTGFLDPNGLRGARLGVARNYMGVHPKVDALMAECIAVLRGLGAEIVDPANIETMQALREPEMTVLLYEFKTDLDAYLAGVEQHVAVHSLADVITFNEAHRDTVMPYFSQERMVQAQAKGPLSSEEYRKARAACRQLARRQGIDATLRKHTLDAIIAPSGGPACFTDWVNGDAFVGGSSPAAAVAGYPNLTVPAGYVHGLPVGISFFAGAYQEGLLIKLAYAFEQTTLVRRPPRFLERVELAVHE